MILFTISSFFKVLIALLTISNRFDPSSILLDLENREISQLKANQNMYRLLDTSFPTAARTELMVEGGKGAYYKWN